MIHELSKRDKYFIEFRIADTFTDSLSQLTSKEQKALRKNVFDLQLNSSFHYHKLDCTPITITFDQYEAYTPKKLELWDGMEVKT